MASPALANERVALATKAGISDNGTPDPTGVPESAGGGPGEPGGTRAMGACEPGQAGNGAAISIAFMRAGAPPRLSQPPAEGA